MGSIGRAGFALLTIYSLWLISFEMSSSQAQVRPYYSDIGSELAFFAVNTTMSVAFLAGAALLLLFAGTANPDQRDKGREFLLSQAALFAFLAADDRFQLHERIGWRLGIGDHYVTFAWALAELGLLAAYWRPALIPWRATRLFLAGGALFTVSFLVDALANGDALLRLSAEDLAKTWGAAMFFSFGWETARFHLRTKAVPPPRVTAPMPCAPGTEPAQATTADEGRDRI
ncbi:hypothetical protein [Sphingomonas sp.]|uniref:hypothetical protein n=1 Tax=Sphingomonas sp. TaxID=28214 RepID=UPI002FC9063A